MRMHESTKSSRFQSAPLTDVRGDRADLNRYLCRARFQSAPLTDVRGDIYGQDWINFMMEVSIRSPHGCKGRFTSSLETQRKQPFQSAPLTDVRGDAE